MKHLRQGFGILIIITVLFPLSAFGEESGVAKPADQILGEIPVQQAGRVKPFESFAKEIVLFVTGKTRVERLQPVELVWRWMANSDEWAGKPLLPVTDEALRKEFSADLVRGRIAPSLVLADLNFTAKAGEARAKQNNKEKLTQTEKARLELEQRARLFVAISHGELPGFIPHPDDPQTSWVPLSGIMDPSGRAILAQLYPETAVDQVNNSLEFLLTRIRDGQFDMAAVSADFFSGNLRRLLESRDIVLDQTLINLELWYLRFKPFHLAWILYLLSVVLWAMQERTGRLKQAPIALYFAGFAMHTLGFVLRCLIAGRPPVTNMYESVIWVSWGVILFSLILFWFYRYALVPMVASGVASLGLLIGENLPTVLDQSISPLVPVLRNNFWLTIHVLTITLGYGAFLLNWGVAHALLYASVYKKGTKQTITHLTTLLYRSLQIGIILLAAGTILGGVWAAYSWGRFWGGDPKETWALIALLAYLAVMHGRTAGWLDSFHVAFSARYAFCVF